MDNLQDLDNKQIIDDNTSDKQDLCGVIRLNPYKSYNECNFRFITHYDECKIVDLKCMPNYSIIYFVNCRPEINKFAYDIIRHNYYYVNDNTITIFINRQLTINNIYMYSGFRTFTDMINNVKYIDYQNLNLPAIICTYLDLNKIEDFNLKYRFTKIPDYDSNKNSYRFYITNIRENLTKQAIKK